MVEKLKSALKIIHWSLAFKAVAAGLAWVYLPWWLSLLVILGIYFIPLFQTRHLFMSFLLALILASVLPSNIFSGLVVTIQIYLILGVKDFIFINRKWAMQVLAALFLAEAGVAIYLGLDNWLLGSFVNSFLFGLVYYLVGSKLLYVSSEESKNGNKSIIVILGFVLSQIAFAVNFLPIFYIYKSLILTLAALIFFEWQNLYFDGKLSKNKVISYAVFFIGLVVVIFSTVSWGL